MWRFESVERLVGRVVVERLLTQQPHAVHVDREAVEFLPRERDHRPLALPHDRLLNGPEFAFVQELDADLEARQTQREKLRVVDHAWLEHVVDFEQRFVKQTQIRDLLIKEISTLNQSNSYFKRFKTPKKHQTFN